jgi:hypothetical protein
MYLFSSATDGIIPFNTAIEASNWFDSADINKEDYTIMKEDKFITHEEFYLFLYNELSIKSMSSDDLEQYNF